MMERSKLAGTTVKIREGVTDPAQNQVVGGAEYLVEDWWINVAGESWMFAVGNPAAIHYALRSGMATGNPVPMDDNVLYGKIGNLGHLVHISEIETDA